jgi:hypothetical protein
MGTGAPAISMLSFRCSIPPGNYDHAVEVVEVNASGHMDKIGRLALGGLGLQVSGVIWVVLLMGATLACLEFSLSFMRLSRHPAKYVVALLALS